MTTNGSFIRNRVNFSQVSNFALRGESDLSMPAKGLYSLIQSFITIKNFKLYKNTLRKESKEGERAFERTWKELKDSGFLIQHKLRDKKTNQFYYEYELLDKPLHVVEKEEAEKMAKIKYSSHTHTLHPMGNAPSAKEGVYNNTDLNNTNLNNTDYISSSMKENIEEDKKIKIGTELNKNNIVTNNDIAHNTIETNDLHNKTILYEEIYNDKDVHILAQLCQKLSFKLKKVHMQKILTAFSVKDIIRAITTITTTSTFIENKIKNHLAYLLKTLNDFKITKSVIINSSNNGNNKRLSFTDYEGQREYDWSGLEEEMLAHYLK